MRSIRRRVLLSAVATLAAGALLALPLTYWITLQDVDELFDERLRQVALSVSASRAGEGVAATADANAAAPMVRQLDEDGEEDIELVTEVWGADGKRRFSTHPEAGLPFIGKPGLSQVHLRGAWWHVYGVAGEGHFVQAAQPASERSDMAFDAAWNLGLALLAVFAAVGVALVLALRGALGGLDRAAAALASRSEKSLAPIGHAGAPQELLPLVDAIDALLLRLDTALAQQRRFVADAAHELRTPVTALKLQWALLQRAPNAAARTRAIAELGTGINRAQRLVAQLLDLSRTEPDAPMPQQAFDAAALVQAVVAERAAFAAQRGVVLRADAAQPVALQGDRHAIEVLLRNLVDNALRHAGSGPVEVAALFEGGCPALRVTDQGPGIPPAERARVFDRFYRRVADTAAVEGDAEAEIGSGLGLAIVKAVAERHGATLHLSDGPGGRGLMVLVTFKP
jgi:two-component system, OmpR family, sensor kinase